MKVWCSRDDDGTEVIWRSEPKQNQQGLWEPHRGLYCAREMITEDPDFILLLFPKGVKKGQCVKCTLKRLEVDDE